MSDHMKRLAAPRTWPLKRKVSIWVTKQSAGAHSIEDSMSAVTVLRDMVGACDTAREAKRIIGNREMFVDGKAVKNPKAPVGFMDVISIPKMNLNYRMLITDKGKLTLVPIDADEAAWEICKIQDKTVVKGGKIQLNLSGGRNILLDKNLLLCSCILCQQSIKTVKEVEIVRGSAPNLVIFTDGTQTVVDNCFVIGAAQSAIKLPEASE